MDKCKIIVNDFLTINGYKYIVINQNIEDYYNSLNTTITIDLLQYISEQNTLSENEVFIWESNEIGDVYKVNTINILLFVQKSIVNYLNNEVDKFIKNYSIEQNLTDLQNQKEYISSYIAEFANFLYEKYLFIQNKHHQI